MGVQLPRSPVRLSFFRCSSLFVLLYGFFVSLSGSLAPLCTASLFRCPTPSLDSSCSLSFARVPYIYIFFYMGVKSGWFVSMISWEKPFPHPTPFFGFNTSCFWRRKVLYLYRDMGGASAPPFFCYFPFKNGDFRSASGKNLPSSNFNLPSSNLN